MIRFIANFAVSLFLVLCAGSVALAAVSGRCDNCHTMHNSQGGSAVVSDGGIPHVGGTAPTGPQYTLLNTDCVGCHSSTTASTIVSGTPIVYNTIVPTNPLAGGNFYWVADAGGNDDTKGHNVYGISGIDSNLTVAPGAVGSAAGCGVASCHSTLASGPANNGCTGCHVPRHHDKTAATVIGQEGGWYRFLGSNMAIAFGGSAPTAAGVTGIEDSDWEQTVGAGDHNVYRGTVNGYGDAGAGPYLPDSSIGQKCAGCHGNFHHDMHQGAELASNPWVRHPSDVVIPNSGEYAGFNGDGSTYSTLAPVAQSVAGLTLGSTVTLGSDVVTCISCHRAHGSPYPDMLRWDYANDCNNAVANPACGCFVCHTGKD